MLKMMIIPSIVLALSIFMSFFMYMNAHKTYGKENDQEIQTQGIKEFDNELDKNKIENLKDENVIILSEEKIEPVKVPTPLNPKSKVKELLKSDPKKSDLPGLSSKELQLSIRSKHQSIQDCRIYLRDDDVKIRFTVTVSIQPNGSVGNVRLDNISNISQKNQNKERENIFKECLVSEIQSIKFPASKGGSTTFTQTISIQ